jgi:hypothetical protein
MNQLGDMGNKEKENHNKGWQTRRKEARKEGRRRQSFMAMPPPMHNNLTKHD